MVILIMQSSFTRWSPSKGNNNLDEIAMVILIMQSSFTRWSPSKSNNLLDEIANGGGVLDPSLDHQIKQHEPSQP